MRLFLLSILALLSLLPLTSNAEPRAILRSDSGYLQKEQLIIDGKPRQVSNFLMSTYDIEDFSDLKEKDGEAWRALHNHYRYGVVGTRGFLGGLGAALATVIATGGKAHWSIPSGLFLVGFVYGMNCRHMAKHNLHKAINILNGVQELGTVETPRIDLMVEHIPYGGVINLAFRVD